MGMSCESTREGSEDRAAGHPGEPLAPQCSNLTLVSLENDCVVPGEGNPRRGLEEEAAGPTA